MNDKIKLSVIIPYYNAEQWIGKMLDTLLDQDISKDIYEIIVIDDGSTHSVDSLQSYTDKYPNIHYYREDNAGLSAARNWGIELAKGEWLYFCDSDDYVQPQVFGFVLNTLESLDLDMLVCDWHYVQPDVVIQDYERPVPVSEVYSGKEYLASFASDPMSIGFGVWRYFIRRSVIFSHDIRFEDLAYIEDRLFQLELLLVVKRLVHASVKVYYYLQHPTSLLHSQKKRKYVQYAPWLWHYIERLSNTMADKSLDLSNDAIRVMEGWRDMAVFSLLINSFRYCPVSYTKDYLSKLSALDGAYPVKIMGRKHVRLVRRLMNTPRTWSFLCSLLHLLPQRIRLYL